MTANEIDENEKLVIELIKSIKRDFDKNLLISFLNEYHYFTEVGSTKYKYSEPGGLCAHSIDVFKLAESITKSSDVFDKIDRDSLIIVSLFHDLYKCFSYSPYVQNKKNYREDGSKTDDVGRYEWDNAISYSWNPIDFVKMFPNPKIASVELIRQYIPSISFEEISAIINIENKFSKVDNENSESCYSVNKLACVMASAEFISMYC